MSRKSGTRCNRHVISLRDRAPRHATRSVAVIPAEGAGLRPASEGRNPAPKPLGPSRRFLVLPEHTESAARPEHTPTGTRASTLIQPRSFRLRSFVIRSYREAHKEIAS